MKWFYIPQGQTFDYGKLSTILRFHSYAAGKQSFDDFRKEQNATDPPYNIVYDGTLLHIELYGNDVRGI